MKKTTIKYFIDGTGTTVEDAYEIETYRHVIGSIAEECAEDFHSNHDGWDNRWPVIFILANEEDNILGKFEIERRSEPVFIAQQII